MKIWALPSPDSIKKYIWQFLNFIANYSTRYEKWLECWRAARVDPGANAELYKPADSLHRLKQSEISKEHAYSQIILRRTAGSHPAPKGRFAQWQLSPRKRNHYLEGFTRCQLTQVKAGVGSEDTSGEEGRRVEGEIGSRAPEEPADALKNGRV